MKLGDVLRKERERRGISVASMALRLGRPEPEYRLIEDGNSAAERWGPLLAQAAIKLAIPTSRLISKTGRAADALNGGCGWLIKERREKCERSLHEMAKALELSAEAYEQIELGESPIEEFGPLLLHFAEIVEQPIFNLFYPCCLPLEKLKDYP
jgi:transcriptional regulator with XRE-family HTH domain